MLHLKGEKFILKLFSFYLEENWGNQAFFAITIFIENLAYGRHWITVTISFTSIALAGQHY